MISVNDAFFTVNGRVRDENRIRKAIYNRIKPCITSGIAKRVTNLMDALRMFFSALWALQGEGAAFPRRGVPP